MIEVYCGDIPILSLKHVYRTYPGAISLLKDINFEVWPGEFVYITGPSGAGKTTLLKLIYKAVEPESGNIFLCGKDITKISRDSIPYIRRNMGIVFQDFNLIDWMTVEENLSIPLEILGYGSSAIKKAVAEILEKVGLGGSSKKKAGILSGGEKQRIAVARAAITKPPIILADEPTGNLDQQCASTVIRLLEKFSKEGTAVLVATHDELLLTSCPHRTMAIMDGRLVDVDYANSLRHKKIIEAMEAA